LGENLGPIPGVEGTRIHDGSGGTQEHVNAVGLAANEANRPGNPRVLANGGEHTIPWTRSRAVDLLSRG